MTESLTINRLPRAFDQSLGDETRALLADLTTEQGDLIAGTAGSSPYLKSLIEQEREWLPQALREPDHALAEVMEVARTLAPDQLKLEINLVEDGSLLVVILLRFHAIMNVEVLTLEILEALRVQ